jgi:hypothetical protein
MLAQIKPTNLTAYVGTEFDVLDDPAHLFCLKLTEIVEHLKTERQEAFSLFFRGPSNSHLLQGIHKLKHAQLGEFEIFLVPVAQDKDGFQYEAAFNHVISM